MSCKHEHLRTVGDRLFCKDCGEELPIEFLTGGKPAKEAPAEADQAEIQPAEEKAEESPQRKKPRKSPAKKKTPKQAE